MIPMLESTLETSLIVLLALAVLPLLRRRTAAFRHWVLAASILCAAAAPLVGPFVPVSPFALPISSTIAGLPDAAAVDGAVPVTRSAVPTADPVPAPSVLTLRSAILAAWIVGMSLSFTLLLVGFAQLAAITRRAHRLRTGPLVDRARSICAQYGIRKPVTIFLWDHQPLLVTWGLWRPKLVLPRVATGWGSDRLDLVLRHELAHVYRGDWATQLVAEVLRSIFWFNPLLWVACARLRQESERACDDEVLTRGAEGANYAAHLVEIARDFSARRQWGAAPAMARPSSLERRVRAMLDVQLNRGPVSRAARAATLLALLAVTIPVAGIAAQTVFSKVAGSIVDPMNGVLPGVTLVLTNPETKAKYEVTSDSSGRYEFVGVPAGDYVFEARLPGFAVMQGRMTVSGQNVQKDLTLQVGTLQETINVQASRAAAAGTLPAPSAPRPAAAKRPIPPCGQSQPTSGVLRVGGNIRPPHKVKDVRPVYPADLAAKGVAGTVQLQATIGPDGVVDQVDVVSTPHPDLGAAASTAVRQWEFDSTLLNCMAIPVSMKVTVNFSVTN